MLVVRFLLTFAIALHLSGVPAVAVSPCAGGEGDGHSCCMQHPARARVPAIGYCCCPVPAQSGDSVSAVSTVAGSPEKPVAPATAAVGPAGFVPAVSQVLAVVSLVAPAPDPPPLTALGLRC